MRGWHEAQSLVITDKGVEKKAPRHYEVASRVAMRGTLKAPVAKKDFDESKIKALKSREPWQMSMKEYIYGDQQLSNYDREKWREQFNMSYPASGRVKVYRGAWQHEREHLSPGDWVTLDRKHAQSYAGRGGKIFEAEVPTSELYHNVATSMPGKSELIWRPEASLQRYDKHGNYMLLADYHRQEVMKAIRDGGLKSHPDYPEFAKKVVGGKTLDV